MSQCYPLSQLQNADTTHSCQGTSSCWQCRIISSDCKGRGNSDVDGPGVLLAFLIFAGIAILAAWIDLFCNPSVTAKASGAKRLDQAFARGIFRSAAPHFYLPTQWTFVNHKIVLLVGDQMIITGAAILFAGYVGFHSLSTYSFQIITWQAWLATSCHQAAMMVLRDHFDQQQTIAYIRIFFMTVIYVMLFAALIVVDRSNTSHYSQSLRHEAFSADSAVQCAWRSSAETYAISTNAAASVTILTLTHFTRASKALFTPSSWFTKWLRDRPSQWLKRCYVNKVKDHRWWDPRPFLLILIYVHARALYDSYESHIMETLWLTLNFVYGCSKIFAWRSSAPADYSDNGWGFGQLLALLGILILVLALPELHAGN
jgi:hypothetical protein